MSEKRKVRRNRNITSGSMALNVRSSALPKRRYLPKEQPQVTKRTKQKPQRYAKMKFAPSIDFLGFAGMMIVFIMI